MIFKETALDENKLINFPHNDDDNVYDTKCRFLQNDEDGDKSWQISRDTDLSVLICLIL